MSATRQHPPIGRRSRPGDHLAGRAAPPGPVGNAAPPRRRPNRSALAVGALLLVAAVALGTAVFLLLLALRPHAPARRTIVITMHHTHFDPARIEVGAGTTVRFVLRNTDPIDHEFILGDEAVQRRHRVGRERHHDGDVPGEISVPSGTVATTTVRFDHAGKLAYACHLPGHEAYGMVGVVDVR